MQISRLSKRNKRALLILGGLVAGYVAIFYLFLPLLDRQREIGGQIASTRQEVQRYLKALEQRPLYANHLHRVRETVQAYENHFLEVLAGCRTRVRAPAPSAGARPSQGPRHGA